MNLYSTVSFDCEKRWASLLLPTTFCISWLGFAAVGERTNQWKKPVDGGIFRCVKWKEESRAALIDQWVNQTPRKAAETREISFLNECCWGPREENDGWQSMSHRSAALFTLEVFAFYWDKSIIARASVDQKRLGRFFCALLLRLNEKSMTIYCLFSTRFRNRSQLVRWLLGICHSNTRLDRFSTNGPLIDSLGTFVDFPFIGKVVKTP